MIDPEDVRTRLRQVRDRIDGVERPWAHRVAVVGVTKGFGADAVVAAVAAGCDAVGENYAQELLDKRATIERLVPEVHFIGRLQRNKVRQLADIVDVWCSLDRASAIDEVAKRAPGGRVLIQVDTTGDPGKGGCDVAETAALVDRAAERGLIVPRADDGRTHRRRQRGRATGIPSGSRTRRRTRPGRVLDGDVRRSRRRRRGGQHRSPRRHCTVRPTATAANARALTGKTGSAVHLVWRRLG